MSALIGALRVTLGLDSAAFERGSKRVQAETQGLSNKFKFAAAGMAGAMAGIATGAILSGLQGMVANAFELASSMSEAAARIGVSVEALQELRVAANASGVSNEDLETAMARLNVQLGELQNGSKKAVAAFTEIGLSADDLKGKSPQEALGLIADKLAAIEDPTTRAAAAQDLLSKSYAKLIPLLNEGSKGLDEAARASRAHGQITTEDARALDDLADSWDALKTRVAVLTGHLLGQATTAFNNMHDSLAKVGIDAGKLEDWLLALSNPFSLGKAAADLLTKAITQMNLRVAAAIREMVGTIGHWIGDKLGALWDMALTKIKEVGDTFAWLYDVVVGHSYVPDMVDGIAAEMARLDAVMVSPAAKATAATAEQFKALRDELDRLFPEKAKAGAFNADLSRIAGSALNDNDKTEATMRLWREFLTGSPLGNDGPRSVDFGDAGGPLVQGMGQVEDAIESLTEKSKIGTVRIAQSFKDMAEGTMQALSRLTGAIKGGGFFDIVEAVISTTLQLGSAGAFGKGVAGFLNKATVPGFALGTPGAPAGLALVGEHGPELVNFRGGERVYNNRDSRGMMGGNVYHFQGNLMTPEFWAQIQAGDAAAAQIGARGGEARVDYRNSRRLA